MATKTRIYVLSDSLGHTAEEVAKAAASQFADDFTIIKWPNVNEKKQVEDVIKEAKIGGSVIFYTLVSPELNRFLEDKADEYGVLRLNILGPALSILEEASNISPSLKPGASRKINGGYFEKIRALDFAVKHDDGRNVASLKDAEIVIIGVSRTSKTPLSVYLAYRGWKVANVPLVYGVDLPKELFQINPNKIFGLIIDAGLLREIREQRLESVGSGKNGYADVSYILKELGFAKEVMLDLGCRIINVTHKAIEETASEILKYYNTMNYEGANHV
ncbi:MAG: pyruvate, water dikinase regulatory protein [Actinomycetota bacterium]|nr:pyruvate, water dikinase regulatory protein [Actinomycetota bacterium]